MVLETIPGLGFVACISLACETNEFALIGNINQLVSYAGFGVKLNESVEFKDNSII